MAVTETITVLFTDLVGSTEISYEISPDDADELLRVHFSVLRQAIAGSGGVEVKGLGDGVMVVFRSTSAAMSCAVAMQQAVHRDNVGARHQLGLRIGLSGGEATMESNDYYGDPVIEAARLCAHADAGQILAADAVRVMAGRRSPYLFERIGALELKGLPEPVEVLDVRWEPLDEVAAENGVPLPARLTHVPLTGVIARETEVAMVTDAYKRAAAGEGRAVVLVSGDAGVGKTTLVAEAARRAAKEGACVLLGRCQEDVSASYAPFAEALHHYVAHAPEHVLRTHVEAHGGDITSMVPALGQRLGADSGTDEDGSRHRALPPLWGGGGPSDGGLHAPTNRARTRRLAMVGQSKPSTPASCRRQRRLGTAARARDVPGQRALAFQPAPRSPRCPSTRTNYQPDRVEGLR